MVMKTYKYEFLGGRQPEIATPVDTHTEFEITALISVYYNRFAPSFRFPGERHNFFEFYYVVNGDMVTTIDDKKYYMSAGDYIMVPPMHYHSMEPRKTYATGISVLFDASGYPETVFGGKLSSFGKQILSNLVNCYAQNVNDSEFRPKVLPSQSYEKDFAYAHTLKLCVENIALIALYDYNQAKPKETNSQKNKDELALKILAYLEKNYKENPSLQKISEDLNYSVPHICRTFRRAYNETVVNYIIKLKIDEALKLIEQNAMSFREISDELGFDGVAYFSRIFKQYTGTTPSAYRKFAIYSHLLNSKYLPYNFEL